MSSCFRRLGFGVAQDAQEEVGAAFALQHCAGQRCGEHGRQAGVFGQYADFQFAQIAVVEAVAQ
jgi:hypothetical protein